MTDPGSYQETAAVSRPDAGLAFLGFAPYPGLHQQPMYSATMSLASGSVLVGSLLFFLFALIFLAASRARKTLPPLVDEARQPASESPDSISFGAKDREQAYREEEKDTALVALGIPATFALIFAFILLEELLLEPHHFRIPLIFLAGCLLLLFVSWKWIKPRMDRRLEKERTLWKATQGKELVLDHDLLRISIGVIKGPIYSEMLRVGSAYVEIPWDGIHDFQAFDVQGKYATSYFYRLRYGFGQAVGVQRKFFLEQEKDLFEALRRRLKCPIQASYKRFFSPPSVHH